MYERLLELIAAHRSTLIFVNTRRLAERIAHALRELLGEDAVASHHGSLSKEIRKTAEERLKNGQLKAIVATASLELGIDIGLIDLVCQIGSPRSIATFLQRIGRSGHSLGGTPKGRLFPLTRDELLESIALVRAVQAKRLDAIEIPMQPLDILAQQIIAEVAQEEWCEDALFARVVRAWPYRRLERHDFDEIVSMVSEGVNKANGRGAYVHRDRINGVLRGKRGARLAATTSGGAIPERAEYRVVTEGDQVVVGTVDEDFAIDSVAGSVFLLGNNTWRVVGLRGGDMVVQDAQGQSPNVPFWFGEAPGRTIELSAEVSTIRSDIANRLVTSETPSSVASHEATGPRVARTSNDEVCSLATIDARNDSSIDIESADSNPHPTDIPQSVVDWLAREGNVNAWGAYQAALYVAAQVAAVGLVPTKQRIVFERFFDESGGTQLVIHAPLGSRITRAWGLSLRKRFCRSFDFELQAAADDNGVVLSLGPQHSLPIENLFTMLLPENGQYLLEQAMLAVPFFQIRWRWNVTRALGVLRRNNGKKVPPHLQRFRSDDLLASAFPETVGCLENHHGDVQIPSHPLVTQTMRDCLFEATDVVRFVEMLQDIVDGEIELIARDTTEPSPFSHELLNANPYAFLDDAPLEERRSRAVATRRSLSPDQMRDLGQLDPEAVKTVRQQAWPLVRNADELHEALLSMVLLDELDASPWQPYLDELVDAGRAANVKIDVSETACASAGTDAVDERSSDVGASTAENCSPKTDRETRAYWFAAEHLPLIVAAFPRAVIAPTLQLPPGLDRDASRSEARVALVRGYISYSGPTTVDEIAELRLLDQAHVQSALESLEGEGTVMRGHFTDRLAGRGTRTPNGAPPLQWCERRLLARIHQLTLSGLRKQIQPVSIDDYYAYVLQEHQLVSNRPEEDQEWSGPVGLREVVSKLEGFDLPAGAWEELILAPRLAGYDPHWLDELFMAGELVWGRIATARSARQQEPSCSQTKSEGDLSLESNTSPPRTRRRNAKSKRGSLSRNTPISLMLRLDLPWLIPPHRELPDPVAGTSTAAIFSELMASGAQFGQEIAIATGIAPPEVQACLSELAASGHVTGDSFAFIRAAISRRRNRSATTRRTTRYGAEHRPAIGRWSMFPPRFVPPANEERLEAWCHLLLRRYGIVFRELLTRESSAPRWFELQGMFRRLEMRGEIRGGRFVAGVGGEQFALPTAITRVREIRDQATAHQPTVISAADPLNLVGILDSSHSRLTSSYRNALLIRQGRCVAVRNGVDIEFLEKGTSDTQSDDHQLLLKFGLPQRSKAIRERRKRFIDAL